MKFNEKELALWASSFVSDREGLLDKKGAARGQGEGREREREREKTRASRVTEKKNASSVVPKHLPSAVACFELTIWHTLPLLTWKGAVCIGYDFTTVPFH